ncbi:hypothetical protein RHGRI_020482 [Rhododendron griersonianum]|uniref:Uncharacterized protein n=1 Tax=Rhododendron griersonianum TaxID=479676 RepID=A0AAV6JHR3_9ERIC|nr:hypothetical protein RHGRI_020482 [Rhododendron griersonianum]
MVNQPNFSKILGEVKQTEQVPPVTSTKKPSEPKETAKSKPKDEPKKEAKEPAKPKEEAVEEEEEAPKPKPSDLFHTPPSKMILDDWKRLYSNTKTNFREVAIEEPVMGLVFQKFGLHAIIVLLKCCHLWRFTMESYQPCSTTAINSDHDPSRSRQLALKFKGLYLLRFDFVDVLLQVLMDGGCMLSMDGDSLRLAWRQVDCEYLFPELALILDACRGKSKIDAQDYLNVLNFWSSFIFI